ARAIGEIRRQLRVLGISVPLVADIHFSPAAAMEAANHVEKVRINPGNFADSRQFAIREYTDLEYEQELERIEQRFTPLVLRCKALGVAMRVGTNHGSLSDRIMNRLGDTIRVSLTEEPEAEIPVAERLAAPYQHAPERRYLTAAADPRETRDPYTFTRRLATETRSGAWTVGGHETMRVLQAIPPDQA